MALTDCVLLLLLVSFAFCRTLRLVSRTDAPYTICYSAHPFSPGGDTTTSGAENAAPPPGGDAVHVQARGGPLRAWARPGPRRTTAGLGSIQAQSGPLQAWIRRGPRRTILGLGPSWPKSIFRRPGEIQAHSGPPRIWTDPSPRQTASGLVPSRAEADWSGPGSVQMPRFKLKAMLVQGACCIPAPGGGELRIDIPPHVCTVFCVTG